MNRIRITTNQIKYLTIFPSHTGNRPLWEFGWAYGVGWGAAIFLFGGVALLLCDKESEEIYYKERKVVHDTQLRA